jgi:hypothetical protein
MIWGIGSIIVGALCFGFSAKPAWADKYKGLWACFLSGILIGMGAIILLLHKGAFCAECLKVCQ